MAKEYEEQPKLQILPTSNTSATFVINEEDHTLGNSLRYMLLRNKETSFCGYSMPHPSEPVINLRLQTINRSATDVFAEALNQMIEVTEHIGATFDAALDNGPVAPGSLELGQNSTADTAMADADDGKKKSKKGKKKE